MRKKKFISFILAFVTVFLAALILHTAIPRTFAVQKKTAAPRDGWLEGIPAGKTLVVDMTYAINGKLPDRKSVV